MVKRNDKVDIFTVANLANVSPATVSRSFNHPHLVRLETRKRIEKVIEEAGYIRNRAAQAMHGKRSGTIGLIVPTVTNAIFSEMIQSFTDAISENGFTLLMATHGFNLRKEYEILRKLLEHRVDGVALIGLDHAEATYQLVERQGVPTVAGWNYSERSRISCIGVDNREAGAVAAEHLVLLGHQRIGMIFPELDGNDRARMRFEGALSVFSSAGIETPESFRARAPYDFGRAKLACTEILAGPNRPTALLCGNDIIALGSMYAARQLGLDVPTCVSIVGIGDFDGSADFEPALSSVRIPARRIGTCAGHYLVSAIAGKADPGITRVRFDVDMIARKTSIGPFGVCSE